MNSKIKSEFSDMKDLISTGYSEVRLLQLVTHQIRSDTFYQSMDQYLDLKRSINNIVFEINSIFNNIIQLSLEEGPFGRMYIKMLLWYYKIRVKPLIWSQREKNM